MHITMYIYGNNLRGQTMQPIRCISCTKLMFTANTDKLIVSNIHGAGTAEHEPGGHYIEIRCRNCNADYAVLFQ